MPKKNIDIHIIHSGWGSFRYAVEHKSKGIFYTQNPNTGNWSLFDGIASREVIEFPSYDELEKYIKEHY